EPQSPVFPATSNNPVQYPQAPQAGSAPQPIAGHELIDQQALPQWMSGQNAAFPPSGQTGFAASSLLDAHALPTWLREENQEQRQQNVEAPRPAQAWQAPNYQPLVGQGQPQNMNNNGVPPRPDTMRVPSRPRAEMGYIEESEG